MASTDLALELPKEGSQEIDPRLRETSGGVRMQRIRDLQQLPKEVVDSPLAVVGNTMATERVFVVVERGCDRCASGETPGNTDGADGVEPVGILQDSPFQSLG